MKIWKKIIPCLTLAACAAFTQAGAFTGEPGMQRGISQVQAEDVAIRTAGGGRIARRNLRTRDDREVYDILVIGQNDRVKLRLDAMDGSVIKMERKPIDRADRRLTGGSMEGILDHDQVRQIALERAGGGVVSEAEQEVKRGGRVLYEVTVLDHDVEYEMEIDGRTGRILKYEEERR